MPPGTFYFIPRRPWISALGQVTHIVAILASAERQEMLVYFELFNAAPVGVLLPYAGTKDVRATYAVDVLTGAEVPAVIDAEAIRGVPWQATHKLADTELDRFTQERIGRLIGLSQEQSWNAEVEALMTRAFGTSGDRPLATTDLVNGVGELVEFILLEWKRPLVTLPLMEEQLRGFDRLCSNFEKAVPSPGRPAFRVLIALHRKQLASAIERNRREGTA